MAVYCASGILRPSTLPFLEHYVNQLEASGVVITPSVIKGLIITLTLCDILKLPCQQSKDANIVTVLYLMKQRKRDCFYATCRLAFVLIRDPMISDSELSNVLLQNGYGCLEDLNLLGLISLPSDYPLHAPCHSLRNHPLFPEEDVQCFLAAIHLLTGSPSLMLSFIRRDVLVVDADPSSLLVLRYMFGLADTLPGICSSAMLLKNILKCHNTLVSKDRPVILSRLPILILQCLFEAQSLTLYEQAHREIFIQQIFSFEPHMIVDSVDAIAHYLLNTSSMMESIWVVYAPVNHPLIKRLDDLGVVYRAMTMPVNCTHNIVISSASRDDAVLVNVATTSPRHVDIVTTTHGMMTKEQHEGDHYIPEAGFHPFIPEDMAVRTQYHKNDHTWFSAPFAERNDVYEKMTPVHLIHQVREMANGGGDDCSGVIDYDYLVPFHQTTNEEAVVWNRTELFDIKNELVCGQELPLIPRKKISIIKPCNESQLMPPPDRHIHQDRDALEVTTLVLPSSQGYDITQPPYEVSLEYEKHEDTTMDDSPISVVDQDEGIYYMYVYMAGDLSRNSPDPTDMRATLTTCCYNGVSPVPEPDWNVFPGITPDSTVYPEDSQIQYHFKEIPVVETSQDGGPFPDEINLTDQNVCEVVGSSTKQLNHTNVLNNWNGNETSTLEVYHKGTFYAVRKASFNWRDVVIAPKLTFMNIIQLVAMIMMGHPPLQQGHMYHGVSCNLERCIIGSCIIGSYGQYCVPLPQFCECITRSTVILHKVGTWLLFVHKPRFVEDPILNRYGTEQAEIEQIQCFIKDFFKEMPELLFVFKMIESIFLLPA